MTVTVKGNMRISRICFMIGGPCILLIVGLSTKEFKASVIMRVNVLNLEPSCVVDDTSTGLSADRQSQYTNIWKGG